MENNNMQMTMGVAKEINMPIQPIELETPKLETGFVQDTLEMDKAVEAKLEEVRGELLSLSFDESETINADLLAGDNRELKMDENEAGLFQDIETIDNPEGNLAEKEQTLGEVLGQINENVAKLDQSMVTKEDLLQAMLLLYALSKEEDEGEKLSLFEILVKAMGKILISLTDEETPPAQSKKSASRRSVGLEDMKRMLFKGNNGTLSVVNKAA